MLLASALSELLATLNPMPDHLAAAKLAEVRAVPDAFDRATDDRQYALEQIEDIVNGDDE